MIRRWFTSVLGALLLPLVPGSLTAASAAEPPATLRVLTRNLYLGADLAPVLAATTQEALVGAVTTAYGNVRATNFPERAEALADEIADSDPHLVGLQEAVLWRSQTPANPGPATDIEYDFL
ncbi:hypothetical protein [Streptomyces sp. NPDC059874]|uniref:hypothetical protein n=1 Tax=Streptomyces sp. NPDC059874 TaxID=3346983 RepID=UPI003662C35A